MKKFQNPCGYGIDPQTTREELIDYIEELEDVRKRRNKQIRALKKERKELVETMKKAEKHHQKFIRDLQKNTKELNR